MATNKRLIKSNDEGGGVAASFNTVTYTGNDNINGPVLDFGFQPDFVWIKSRETLKTHRLHDIIRGESSTLFSDTTDAENISTTSVRVNFDFSPTSARIETLSDGWNQLDIDYVAWGWKAGGAAVTNTDGSTTSQVSANQAAGFSIVSYPGESTTSGDTKTIGHGLGVAPSMIITKSTSNDANWGVYHSALTSASYYLRLNLTDAEASASTVWGNTAPTSSVFSVDFSTLSGRNSYDYIAYCFAEVAGFSKFGSYTGIASGNVTVDCGFEPAFVMVKKSVGASAFGSWEMHDNKRSPNIYNPTGNSVRLRANDSSAEALFNNSPIKFTSTGFYLDSAVTANSYVDYDNNGYEYIYMAFANQF